MEPVNESLEKVLAKRRPDSIVLRKKNVRINESLIEYYLNTKEQKKYGHVFVIYNVATYIGRDRTTVCKWFLDYLYPTEMIPMYFKFFRTDCMFFSRDCNAAIYKLCKSSLQIPIRHVSRKWLNCAVVLKYVDPLDEFPFKESVLDVLGKLLNDQKLLNLDSFVHNPELTDYYALSEPKILQFVLEYAASMQPTGITLRNNDIQDLTPLEALGRCKTLKYLDLRNNKINKSSVLETLSHCKLEKLWLDDNPICNVIDECSYIKMVKQIIPTLEYLDDVNFFHEAIVFKTNFLCDQKGYDLVDQFLEHFFTNYDIDRTSLESLYDDHAFFSLTQTYKPGQMSSESSKLLSYQKQSRNLISLADFSRNQEFIAFGNVNILNKLLQLPLTNHDPLSFKVDLIYYTETAAVVTVTGVFEETAPEPARVLGFSRTFVLRGRNNEYVILNDMLHVYNALTFQEENIFTKTKRRDRCDALSVDERKQKAVRLFSLTAGIKETWAQRFLEKSNYDMSTSLTNFVEYFKVNDIPEEVFNVDD